jgi:CRP-like cAMP-binding protein
MTDVITSPLVLKLERRDRLSAEERRVLEAVTTTIKELPANQDLVREGECLGFSTILLSGWAGRVKTLADGQRSIIALHVSGDFIDLHSLLLKPMDHTVSALTNCRMAVVPHDHLREITQRHPHLTRMLWLDTLIDAAIHREWLSVLGRLPALGQLAHLLCELYLRLATVGAAGDGRFTLPLTQSVLADVLGLSPVHVNRTIQDLRREELVHWAGSNVQIKNWDRLVQVAEFEPAYLNLSIAPR